ncbi:hypothetical protein GQ457_01G027820 [Hibiscus cannabinus]
MEEMILTVAVLVTHSVWQPPPVGWLKFNVDKALEAGGNVGGVGGVLRNECGQHLLTFSIRLHGPLVGPDRWWYHTLLKETVRETLASYGFVPEDGPPPSFDQRVAVACFQVQALAVEASRRKRTSGSGRSKKT